MFRLTKNNCSPDHRSIELIIQLICSLPNPNSNDPVVGTNDQIKKGSYYSVVYGIGSFNHEVLDGHKKATNEKKHRTDFFKLFSFVSAYCLFSRFTQMTKVVKKAKKMDTYLSGKIAKKNNVTLVETPQFTVLSSLSYNGKDCMGTHRQQIDATNKAHVPIELRLRSNNLCVNIFIQFPSLKISSSVKE